MAAGLSRKLPVGPILALSATSFLILIASTPWWNTIPPLGDDASSHIVAYQRVAEAFVNGQGWWAPDFNLGFPIGLYYQPMPHFVGGLLTALLGGGQQAVVAYKAISIVLVLLCPWAVALGARLLGLSWVAAAAAGVVTPMIVSSLDFGFTVHASLTLALHTQAWAAIFLPPCLGFLKRAMEGRPGALTGAVVTWTLLSLCHFFYGVAVGAVAVLWVLCVPRQAHWRALRLGIAGLATGLCLLFWLIPLFSSSEAMGGWPFGSSSRIDGHGWAGFLKPLIKGDLLDGEDDLPVLTLMAAAGLLVCLGRMLHPKSQAVPARLLVTMLVISGLFTIGRGPMDANGVRDGLGWVADLFPFNRTVQMFRYIGLFHLAAIWLVGYGIGELVGLLRRRGAAWRVPVWGGVAALLLTSNPGWPLAFPVVNGGAEVMTAFRTVDDANLQLEPYSALIAEMRAATAATGAGRIFVHPRSGLRGHFHSGLLALWEGSDAGQSYGVGLHDSLNFYFLEFFHPESERDDTLLKLYGFQYIAADTDHHFDRAGAELIYSSPRYTYWRMRERVPLCSPIDVAGEVNGFPRDRRHTARAWLNGNGPAVGVHPLLAIPDGTHFDEQVSSPVEVDAVLQMTVPETPVGQLRLDQRSPDRHVCRVDMAREGAVLVRVGYHPFWRATVDGEPAETRYAFPAFAAVEVGPGEHEVVLQYRLPKYVHPLLALSLLVPIGLWWWEIGRRR